MRKRAPSPSTVRWFLIACAIGIMVVAIVASTGGDTREAIPISTGTIYSTDSGDPLDVVTDLDDGNLCMNAGAFGYGTSINCVDEIGADATGSYIVLLPSSGHGSAFVVGVMPEAAVGATVTAAGDERRAETRGRWFTLELPGVSADEASAIGVDFFT